MKHYYVLPLALLLGTAGWSASAQTLSLEEKLAAIRKGLVEVALEGPTKITSTQWIDGKGSLQESNSFRSGVEVRGVRVIGYGTNEQGEATAKLQVEDSSSSKGQKSAADPKKSEPACKPIPGGRLQHMIGLQWDFSPRFGADELPLVEELRSKWSAQIASTGAAGSLWRVADMPQSAKRSSYEQALLGSGLDDLPWRLEISVKPFPKPESGLLDRVGGSTKAGDEVSAGNGRSPQRYLWPSAAPVTVALDLELRLYARNQSRPVLKSSSKATLEAQDNNWGVQQLSTSSRTLVLQQAENWSLELFKTLVCLPVAGEVTQAHSKQFRINLGASSGLRVGDNFLLADTGTVPQRILEAGNAGQTVMAKVHYVGPHYAQLVPSAGPGEKVQARWAAWSADEGR